MLTYTNAWLLSFALRINTRPMTLCQTLFMTANRNQARTESNLYIMLVASGTLSVPHFNSLSRMDIML